KTPRPSSLVARTNRIHGGCTLGGPSPRWPPYGTTTCSSYRLPPCSDRRHEYSMAPAACAETWNKPVLGASGRNPVIFLGLAVLGLLSLAVATAIGSVPISPGDLWAVFSGHGDPLHQELIFSLRLPRASAAFATGALLSLAGALMP